MRALRECGLISTQLTIYASLRMSLQHAESKFVDVVFTYMLFISQMETVAKFASWKVALCNSCTTVVQTVQNNADCARFANVLVLDTVECRHHICYCTHCDIFAQGRIHGPIAKRDTTLLLPLYIRRISMVLFKLLFNFPATAFSRFIPVVYILTNKS